MMQQLKQLVIQQWHTYSLREKWLWSLLLSALLITVLWQLVWVPSSQLLATKRLAYEESIAASDWVSRALPQLMAVAQTESISVSEDLNLTQWITDSSDLFSLELSRFEPIGQDGLRIWLVQQEFLAVTQWLDAILRQGLQVDDLRVSRHSSSGAVDAVLLLSQP